VTDGCSTKAGGLSAVLRASLTRAGTQITVPKWFTVDPREMNWTKIVRCTAVAIGATFVAAATVFAAVRLFALL
jgi:hypothetical protein